LYSNNVIVILRYYYTTDIVGHVAIRLAIGSNGFLDGQL